MLDAFYFSTASCDVKAELSRCTYSARFLSVWIGSEEKNMVWFKLLFPRFLIPGAVLTVQFPTKAVSLGTKA